MNSRIYRLILERKKKGKKLFAVLIDPDKFSPQVVLEANKAKADLLFIGGSKLKKGNFERCMTAIEKKTNIPLVIFPGNKEQVSKKADALLLLSLISGRNPDYLIGEHVQAARQLKKSGLEIIPTGYLLIGGGSKIATQKVTGTSPIKSNNIELTVSTAIAGEMLGMKLIYLEAGSGAGTPLNPSIVNRVRKNTSVPLIAGGGIDSAEKARKLCRAGADIIVVGNAIEKDCTLVHKIAKAIHSLP